MPLSEFHRAATKKLECTQSKMTTCTSDVSSFMPDHDFVELLWENGQIVMQGQSNRLKKSSYPTPFPSHSLRAQEKGGRDPAIQKFSQFEALDTTVNELSPAVPCANIGLNAQDDDMSPWINYQMEDPLCSEFFSELAGISPNPPSTERSNAFAVKDFHNVEDGHSSKALGESSEPGRLKSNHLLQSLPPQQCQSSVANGKSRLTGFSVGGSGTISTHQGQFQKQDLGPGSKNLQGSSGNGLMNFSHFLRPASFASANTESLGRSKMNGKVSSATASTNPIESTLIESSGVRGNSGLDLHKVEIRSAAKGKGGVVSVEQQRSEAICREDALRNNHQNNSVVANNNGTSSDRHINHQSSSFAASVAVGRQEADKCPDAVVASSVCSGNSVGAASNDPKHIAKRKTQEGEESVYHSEDLDDDSIGLKKPAAGQAGTSTKRSRAAEVHNLSERRRRDRINEKMRALQELIPNCNKVDKASMLDEAIEYLKTLQLQVQMMSMGSGLCMPPMMLPPGMQHFRTPHMAHFSPVGVGVGMGLGLSYGMGMLNMNGSPMIPVPSMHTPQFPCSSIPGASGLHGIPGSTGLQLFGIPGHHGQGLPMSMPRAPHFSPMSGLAAKGSSMNEVSGAMVNPLPVSDAGSSPWCKARPQQQQCIDLESAQKPSNSMPQVAIESFEQAQLLQIGNLALQANGNATSNSISATGNASYK